MHRSYQDRETPSRMSLARLGLATVAGPSVVCKTIRPVSDTRLLNQRHQNHGAVRIALKPGKLK